MLALCWIAAILFGLLALIDPRKLWWATSAWQFRNPEANEPSAAANAVGRVVAAVFALGFGIAAISMTIDSAAPYTQERLDELGRQAGAEFGGSYYKYGSPGESSIDSWLDDETGGSVTVAAAGRTVESLGGGFKDDSRYVEKFELTSTDDESAQGCLTTEYDGGLFHDGDIIVSASYDSGPC